MMKKRFAALTALALSLLLALSGCGYVSKYKALLLVQSNTPDSAFMSFMEFEGTMVFRLKNPNAGGKLICKAKLEDGSATVFCDCDGEKRELFAMSDGDFINDAAFDLPQAGKVTVIIETGGKCKEGDFKFDIG